MRELNGKKIVNGSALQVAVSQIAPGNTIDLGILRNGKPETVNVKVGEFHGNNQVAENGGSDSNQHGKLGLAVDNLSPDLRSELNVPSTSMERPIKAFAPPAPLTKPVSPPATSSSKSTASPSRVRRTL